MSAYSERWRDDEASWRSRAAAAVRMAAECRKRGDDGSASDYDAAAARLEEHAARCAQFAAAGEEAERLAAECDQRVRREG